MFGEEHFTVRLDVEDWDRVIKAARKGDVSLANEQREKLRAGRSAIFENLGRARADDGAGRHTLEQLLIESRASEDRLDAAVRAAQDDVHAGRMVDLANTSNTIARESQSTAKALKTWTKVLALTTMGLVLATLGLVYATFQLVE